MTIVLLSQQPKKQFIVSTYQKADYDAIVKTQKRDSRRLQNLANLSESLYFWAFIELFTCFVTEDRPSPHGLTRQEVRLLSGVFTIQRLPPEISSLNTYRFQNAGSVHLLTFDQVRPLYCNHKNSCCYSLSSVY